MVTSDIMQYKSNIMGKLISIPDVYTLINNSEITQPRQMKDKNIFSYMKIPNTTKNVNNYICYDVNCRTLLQNEVLKTVTINIGIICHEDEIITSYGNRHDVLSSVIVDAFNWSKFLGFELELVSDIENILMNEYHVRTLQFKNLAPNSLSNGVKMDGY